MKKFVSILALSILFSVLYADSPRGFAARFENDSVNGVKNNQSAVEGKTGNPPVFVPGISKNALLLEKDELRFPCKDNLSVNNGAVSFWFKAMDWGDKPIHFLPIFAVDGGKGSSWQILLYFQKSPQATVLDYRMKMPDGREIINQVSCKDSLKMNEWNHVVLSWTNQESVIYFNGGKAHLQTYGLPITRKEEEKHGIYFMPAVFWRVPNTHKTALDEVEIFSGGLTDSEAKQLYLKHSGANRKTEPAKAPVPPLKTPVKVDGVPESSEWADASKLPLQSSSSMKSIYTTHPAWVYLKRDSKNLYVGYEIFENEKLVSDGDPDKPSRKTWKGDEVEFIAQTGTGPYDFRQYFLAPNGAWGILQHPAENWNAPSSFRHAAKHNSRGWTGEMVIPLSEILVMDGKIQANFGLHRRAARDIGDEFDRWIAWNTAGKEISFEKNFGTLLFAEAPVRVNALGELEDGILKFQATSGVKLEATDMLRGKTVSYPPGSSDKIPWTGLTNLTLKDKNFSWSSLLNIREPFTLETECDADRRQIEFIFKLSKNDAKLNTPLKEGKLRAKALILAESGRIIGQAEKVLHSHSEVLNIPFVDLPQGKYKLVAILSDGSSETRIENTFVSPDKTFLGNRLGLDSKIPPPWKALKSSGDTVETAFHKYEFGSGPFPVRAWSMGHLVLEHSSGLTLNGIPFKPVGKVRTEIEPGQIVGKGQCVSADGRVKVDWTRTIDYDGLIRVDFDLIPDSKNVSAENFAVSFDVPENQSQVAMTPKLDNDWRRGKNIGASHSITVTGKQGFCLFTDNDTNFVYGKNEFPFTLERQNGKVEVTAHMIRKKVTLDEPAQYTLCVMATPGKPPRANWRKIHSEGWLEYPGQNLAIRGWSHEQGTAGFKRSYLMTQPENPVKLKQAVADYAKKGVVCIPYCCNNIIPSENGIYDYFAKSWARPVHGERTKISILKDFDGTQYYFGVPVCPDIPGFRDYIAFYLAKNMDEFGFKGIYFDFGGSTSTDIPYNRVPRKNVLTRDRKVNLVNVFGVRDLYRRLYKIIRERDENGYLYIHSWRTFHPAYMSFVDIVNPGEEYMHSVPRNHNVYIEDKELSAPEVWRYNYNSEVMGVTVQFLPVFQWCPEIKAWFKKGLRNSFPERFNASRAMITMCLLHDVPISGGGYPGIEGLWPAMDALNLDKAVFMPCYEQKEVTGTDPDIRISYYKFAGNDKAVLILANLAKMPKTTVLDFGKFGFCPSVARDVWPATGKVELDKPVSVDAYGFRILHIEK